MSNFSKCSGLFGQKDLLIWDGVGTAPDRGCITIYWQEHAENPSETVFSIVDLVEQNSDELRARYLSWVYQLGEFKINGKRVIELLTINTGFSYWWAGSFAQKFNYLDASPVNNAIKIFALEDFINKNNFTKLILVSTGDVLVNSLRSICDANNFHFEYRKIKLPRIKKNLKHFFLQHLPEFVKAFIYIIRYITRTLPLYFVRSKKKSIDFGEITFFDIFVHLDEKEVKQGIFKSNYWTELVDALFKSKVKSNWAHIFYQHKLTPTIKQANKLIGSFDTNNLQKHLLLEQPLDIKKLTDIVKNYITLYRSFKLLKNLSQVRLKSTNADLWPLFAKEWKSSIHGVPAMDTCIKLTLFLEMLGNLPMQKMGIYIAENQPWELALIHAWKLKGHRKLIGVPHTIVRYWDLRYFHDPRSYDDKGPGAFPMPDSLAVNGPEAYSSLLSAAYPSSQLLEVEALRFLYLKQMERKIYKHGRNVLRILVCGDFLEKNNNKVITWLESVSRRLPPETEYIIKSHPACPINVKKNAGINFNVSDSPLSELLMKCDVVFTSNSTSASISAYIYGLDVIQVLDGNTFNLSPLRGLDNVVYVRNANDLLNALNKLNNNIPRNSNENSYFYLNEDLLRWRELLGFSSYHNNLKI